MRFLCDVVVVDCRGPGQRVQGEVGYVGGVVDVRGLQVYGVEAAQEQVVRVGHFGCYGEDTGGARCRGRGHAGSWDREEGEGRVGPGG